MNRFLFPDYDSLCAAAAESINDIISANKKASLCLATGSSPEGLYSTIVKQASSDQAKYSSIHIVKLDEWGGLADNHPATCEFYLRNKFVDPLKVSSDRYTSFKSSAQDRSAECRRIQAELDRHDGIDVCVLGLGTNGHLGLNEPAPHLMAHVHVAELTDQTKQHSMLEGSEQKPSWGFTLGMGDLLKSKKIILIVNGQKKTAQLRRLLEPSVETDYPASFLWLHPDVELYTDIDLN